MHGAYGIVMGGARLRLKEFKWLCNTSGCEHSTNRKHRFTVVVFVQECPNSLRTVPGPDRENLAVTAVVTPPQKTYGPEKSIFFRGGKQLEGVSRGTSSSRLQGGRGQPEGEEKGEAAAMVASSTK